MQEKYGYICWFGQFFVSLQLDAGLSLLRHLKFLWAYINKGNNAFRDIVNSEYVDKTSLIPLINMTLNTESCYSCVTRCRRFGKSMAAKMLCAYYDKSCDSRELFVGLKAEKDKSFEKFLNKYSVIYLDVTSFTARPELGDRIVRVIQEKIIEELKDAFPSVRYRDNSDLMDTLSAIHEATGEKFFFIIESGMLSAVSFLKGIR